MREKIWTPLGCEHEAYWGKDREEGDFKAFCCLYATARDFGRIGQLYLDSGMWNGKQIVPREYWKASITPANAGRQGQAQQALRLLLVAGGRWTASPSATAVASTASTWWCSRTRTSCSSAPA